MPDTTRVTAREFRARCLDLLDEVTETRKPLVITRRGRPVARLEPVASELVDPFGALAGSVVHEDDIVSPTGDVWSAAQ